MGQHTHARVLIVLAAIVLGGCAVDFEPQRSMTIQISGTKGTRVAGQYILSTGAGTTRHDLDQEVPFAVDLTGTDVSCMVQKLGDTGTVRVQLLVDGQPVAFDWTQDRYGHVSVSTP